VNSTTITATPIENTPGIGPNLASELRGMGIDTLEALTRVGFWDAWQQLRRANPERDCLPSCLALAGAIAGVRWNAHVMARTVPVALLLAALALALAGCGRKEEPKVDAATERREATERAKEGAFGTQMKALEQAKGLEADLNKKAQESVDKAEQGAK
jgi:predicted small lipoprotein YifL